MPNDKKSDARIYQLKVSLQGARPPIWRRFQTWGNITLHDLHLMIQAVMGWWNYHLYAFRIDARSYEAPSNDFESLFPNAPQDAGKTLLKDVVQEEGRKFTYTYDFGDNWVHTVVVEKITQAEDGVEYPICLAGRRACPPEDFGGLWAYQAIIDQWAREGELDSDTLAWLEDRFEEAFDPVKFDLRAARRRLSNLRQMELD